MMVVIEVDDLLEFAPHLTPKRAEIMIKNAVALASFHAPCLNDPDLSDEKSATAYAIILDALRRWADSGSGVLSSETSTVGPFGQTFSYDTSNGVRTGFYPSEISMLKSMCGSPRRRKTPWSTDTIGSCRRCVGIGNGCNYIVGSTNRPCDTCGGTVNDTII